MKKPISSNTHKFMNYSYDIPSWVSLDDVINVLLEIKTSIPSDVTDLDTSFYYDKTHSYYDSVDVDIKVNVSYWIPLTKEELEKRVEIARKAAATKRENNKKKRLEKEAADRETYERLKAKFEKTT